MNPASDLCKGCKLPKALERHLAGCAYASEQEPEITGPHLCPACDEGHQCELRENHVPKRHAWSDGTYVHLWT